MPFCILDLPGPVPEIVVSFLNPAARKAFRLTCKEACQLVDRTVHSFVVDVANVRMLCGPWRPLHTTFPQLRHLTVCLRSTGALSWDLSTPPLAPAAHAAADPNGGGAAAVAAGGRGSDRGGSRASQGPAAAVASYSLRLLRDSLPQLRHLRSLDLTQCYLDPHVWGALCSAGGSGDGDGDGGRGGDGGSGGGGLRRGLAVHLNPAAALLFSGRTWGQRLAAMLGQLAAAQPHIRVRVAACYSGGGGGRVGTGMSCFMGPGSVGAACWCDVDGAAGLEQLAEMPYISELPMCVWSRAPCDPDWLNPLSRLTRLGRLHISCCSAAAPRGHGWLSGLSALAPLRNLTLDLTDAPLRLSDLAPLSACTALTALSVGTLAAASPPPAVAAAAAANAGGGLPELALPPLPAPLGGGGASVRPLRNIRRLEVRCCLTSGPLPLAEMFPGAVSVSMCAFTVGGSFGGGRRGGAAGLSGRLQFGHVLESLLSPVVVPATTATQIRVAAAPPPPRLARLLPRIQSHRKVQQREQQPLMQQPPNQRDFHVQANPAASGLVPSPLPPPPPPARATAAAALAEAAWLRSGLRSLELTHYETAAITLGPDVENTGRSALPDTAMLGQLTGLEHLQFTGWKLPGGQLPALLAAAQRLTQLRRLTLRCCDGQTFGWRATRLAHLGQGLGLEALAGLQLRAIEHLEVLGSPSLLLVEQLALACRMPALRRLELHGIQRWDEATFQQILGPACRRPERACGKPAAAAVVEEEEEEEDAAAESGGEGGGRGGGVVPPSKAPRVLIALAAAAHAAVGARPGACGRCEAVDVISPCERHAYAGAAAAAAAATTVAGPPIKATPAEEGWVRRGPGCTACLGRPRGISRVAGSEAEAAEQMEDAARRDARRRASRACSDGRSGGGGGDCLDHRGRERGAAAAEQRNAAATCNRRWPRLSYIAVHGCPGASLALLKRQVLAAGLGPALEVDWLPYTQAAGRESWAEAVWGGVGLRGTSGSWENVDEE